MPAYSHLSKCEYTIPTIYVSELYTLPFWKFSLITHTGSTVITIVIISDHLMTIEC